MSGGVVFDLVALGILAVAGIMLVAYVHRTNRNGQPDEPQRPYDQTLDGGCEWQSKPKVLP